MEMLKTNKGGEKKCPQDFGGEENQTANRGRKLNSTRGRGWGEFIARQTITRADYHSLAPVAANISQTHVRWWVSGFLTVMSQNRLMKGQWD